MHDDLRQPSIRYARGADRRDVDLFLSAFADGAVLRVFDPATADAPVSTRDTPERLANVIDRLGTYDATYHLLAQSAYDGDTGEVYCVAHHLKRSEGTDFVMYIRYRDRYTHDTDADEWRIAARDVLVDWTETRRVTEPPTGE
ncbi:MAG TPA: nuclear transport factor 2 family protein [Acidimicrobiales bacterium]|jgi:hypothetical protein|nr:nuclear transport factor 2 family protein [Acidimicrobiales bacterium]